MSQSPNGLVTTQSDINADAQQAETAPEQQGAPSLFLQKIIGSHVTVRLNSGVDYVGILSCLDGYMNIAMEETEEFVGGQSKGRFGDAFIRGNNVLYIEAGKRT